MPRKKEKSANALASAKQDAPPVNKKAAETVITAPQNAVPREGNIAPQPPAEPVPDFLSMQLAEAQIEVPDYWDNDQNLVAALEKT